MKIDILYLAWNRLEFTRFSLRTLLANTDWSLVSRLVVMDDGSEDGTREWLDEALRGVPVETVLRAEGGIGPVALMQRHLADPESAAVFAKIDSDVCVPAGWLSTMLDVLDRYPFVELLGMEAGMSGVAGRDGAPFDGVYGVEPATHIGGVGLMRTSAFTSRPPMQADGRNGFSEFQHTHKPARAWITPDLPVVLLDRLPTEPWRSLSDDYIAAGWQRQFGVWDERWMGWAFDWLPAFEAAA